MKGVNHHCQLIGFFGANTFFHCAGVGPMRYACRMQGNHSPGDILAAHKISIDIIKHFVTIDITVVVRRGYRLWMIVEQPWTKRTNHEIICFESQVNRWRLMDATGDRLKIMDRESKGVTTASPSNDVEMTMPVMYVVQHALLLGLYKEISLFLKGAEVGGWPDVPFAIG